MSLPNARLAIVSSVLAFSAPLLVACTDNATFDDGEPGTMEAAARTSRKPIREALRTTCRVQGGATYALDFFYDDDSQLRGALRGPNATELSPVPAAHVPAALASLGSEWAILRAASGGPTFAAERFVTRFMTSAHDDFVADHDTVKVVDEQGRLDDATCEIASSTLPVGQAIATALTTVPAGEHHGRGRTRAALCSVRIVPEGGTPASPDKLTVTIARRQADGTPGRTLSSIVLDASTQIRHAVQSPRADVFFLDTETAGRARAITFDRLDGSTPLYRVTIASTASNGTGTSYCDTEISPTPADGGAP